MLKKQPSQNTSYSTTIGESIKNLAKQSHNTSLQNAKSTPVLQNGIANAFKGKFNFSVAQNIQLKYGQQFQDPKRDKDVFAQYGGLMRPRKIKPVRAVNRVTDSDRSHKKVKIRSSNLDSPENYTQVNTTEDYSDKDEEGNNRPISKQQRLMQKRFNDEQREQRIQSQITSRMEEEEIMLMETLKAVKDRTILKYVQETINNPMKDGTLLLAKKSHSKLSVTNKRLIESPSDQLQLDSSRPISALILPQVVLQMSKTKESFAKGHLIDRPTNIETMSQVLTNIQDGKSRVITINQQSTTGDNSTNLTKSYKLQNKQIRQFNSIEHQSTQISSNQTFYNPRGSESKGGKPPIDLKTFQRNSSVSVMNSRQQSNFKGNSFLDKKKKNTIEISNAELDKNTTKSNIWSTLLSPQNPGLPEIKSNLLTKNGSKALLNIEEEQNVNQQTERSPKSKKHLGNHASQMHSFQTLQTFLNAVSGNIKNIDKVQPKSPFEALMKQASTPVEKEYSELSPRSQQLKKIQALAYDVMQMIKDFLLSNPSEDKNVDHFGQVFKEVFAKFVQEFRYRGDPKVVYVVIKAEGDILMELRSIQFAIVTYKELKNFCEDKRIYAEKMATYAQLGYCYRLVRYHAVAVDYFKKQLELAWDLNNQASELAAYEMIAMEYFLMNDLENAKVYEERASRGKLERKDSIIRKVCINILQSKREKILLGLQKEGIKKNVLMKPDVETMPDYGHSKGYCLLPYGCPETDPIVDKDAPAISRQIKEAQEAKAKAKHEKQSKVECIMVQRQLDNNKLNKKNREKYDVHLLKKNQDFKYKLFDEDRYTEIVRKAKQRTILGGDDGGKIKASKRIISHQSQLRTMAPHNVKPREQVKQIEEVLLRMVAQTQRILNN